jgi:hypothetical protein
LDATICWPMAKKEVTPDTQSPGEKGCFTGAAARIAFCCDERITSPGVLNTAPAARAAPSVAAASHRGAALTLASRWRGGERVRGGAGAGARWPGHTEHAGRKAAREVLEHGVLLRDDDLPPRGAQ